MSGEAEEARDRRRPSAPIPFTDDEVRELAGGRERSVAAVRRLKRVVPSGPIGKLESELPTPMRISRAEITRMRRAGRRPDKLVARLTPSEAPVEEPAGAKRRSDRPDRRPKPRRESSR